MDSTSIDALALAGLILYMTGFVFYAVGFRATAKRISFLRTVLAAFGVGLFGAAIAVAQMLVHNVLTVAAVSAVGAIVGLYAPKTLGNRMSGRQFRRLGIWLVLLSVAAIGVADWLSGGVLLSSILG